MTSRPSLAEIASCVAGYDPKALPVAQAQEFIGRLVPRVHARNPAFAKELAARCGKTLEALGVLPPSGVSASPMTMASGTHKARGIAALTRCARSVSGRLEVVIKDAGHMLRRIRKILRQGIERR